MRYERRRLASNAALAVAPAGPAALQLSLVRDRDDALSSALRLYRFPGIARRIRRQGLPADVLVVIRIAAGCATTRSDALEQTGVDEDTLVRAATLYLLVALFGDETDPERTLGLVPGSSLALATDHRNWLLKWLHPDRNHDQMLSGLTSRVIAAAAALPVSKAAATPASPVEPALSPEPKKRQRRRRHGHVWVPLGAEG